MKVAIAAVVGVVLGIVTPLGFTSIAQTTANDNSVEENDKPEDYDKLENLEAQTVGPCDEGGLAEVSTEVDPPISLSNNSDTIKTENAGDQNPEHLGSEAQELDDRDLTKQKDIDELAEQQGILRVGNRSTHPLRVVLHRRNRSSGASPAHWDFEPGEGGSNGLTLSLNQQEPLMVQPGDVIVAFAIDGSRRYWGPNVIAETVAPYWNESDRSWTMILQP